ncbi:hypothetical protein VTN00DRAFT_6892 [Thermoascus crustaceus]|uniref:uncharacterized protein n=1 Tax=Thermoascus crustaceus TaxID=5088 RepID=UPI0037440BAB
MVTVSNCQTCLRINSRGEKEEPSRNRRRANRYNGGYLVKFFDLGAVVVIIISASILKNHLTVDTVLGYQ